MKAKSKEPIEFKVYILKLANGNVNAALWISKCDLILNMDFPPAKNEEECRKIEDWLKMILNRFKRRQRDRLLMWSSSFRQPSGSANRSGGIQPKARDRISVRIKDGDFFDLAVV
jgi:hypothetical protein